MENNFLDIERILARRNCGTIFWTAFSPALLVLGSGHECLFWTTSMREGAVEGFVACRDSFSPLRGVARRYLYVLSIFALYTRLRPSWDWTFVFVFFCTSKCSSLLLFASDKHNATTPQRRDTCEGETRSFRSTLLLAASGATNLVHRLISLSTFDLILNL